MVNYENGWPKAKRERGVLTPDEARALQIEMVTNGGHPRKLHRRVFGRNLIVTLTSYDKRLQTVHLAIKSLMVQSVRPNCIVLYLDKSSDAVKLSDELLELQEYGLEIRGGYENLRQHNKYFYAMQEFPNADIITVDDDAIYPFDTIESLVSTKRKYPNCVAARRVHRIRVEDGALAPYLTWEFEWREDKPKPHTNLLATGVGGVLYPAGIMPKETFDAGLINAMECYADDIWLKMHEVMAGVQVVWAQNEWPHPFLIEGTQENARWLEYNNKGRNNVDINNCMVHFSITPNMLVD